MTAPRDTASDAIEYTDLTQLPILARSLLPDPLPGSPPHRRLGSQQRTDGFADRTAGGVADGILSGAPNGIASGIVGGGPVGEADVDWQLVATLRAQASEQLSQAVAADRGRLDRAAQEELGRAVVLDLVESALSEAVNTGQAAWSQQRQRRLARAVFDSLFRLGRLQPLVDDDRVENIVIAGHDNVLLELIDGSLVDGAPVADSDEELIDFLVFLASRSEVNARSFSEAQPRLHLRLDGGSRLAASAWVTPRPSVVIRRHRLMTVTLDDLVAREMMTPVVASFLRAAVRARRSIVVAGAQGAGKTTLVRALCAEIDAFEALGTFETEYELHLHELGRHKIVHAWEARPGSGERGTDGRMAGEFTLDEALVDSFRFNLSRQIVGEVRGKEIWAMIKAMESGTGSISTTHAADAVAAVRKLITCAMEAGAHVTHELAAAKLAATVDLIVQLDLDTTRHDDRTHRRRRVCEIVALAPGERETGYATTHVFTPDTTTRTAVPAVLPEEYRALAAHGFDLTGYLTAQPPTHQPVKQPTPYSGQQPGRQPSQQPGRQPGREPGPHPVRGGGR